MNDLERILYGEPSITARPAVPRVVYDIPKDRERGLAGFIHRSQQDVIE